MDYSTSTVCVCVLTAVTQEARPSVFQAHPEGREQEDLRVGEEGEERPLRPRSQVQAGPGRMSLGMQCSAIELIGMFA